MYLCCTVSACPAVPTAAHVTPVPQAAGCSCKSTDASDIFNHCISGTPTTVMLEFQTMYLIQGIEMQYETDALSEVKLEEIEIFYFNPGNFTWSTLWHDMSTVSLCAI